MARVEFDCELMLQPLPEKVLTDAENVHVLQDAEARPIIICTAVNHSLLMIAPDELGQNQVVKSLQLSPGIKALAVTQDHADNNRIYLVIATQDQGNVASHLHILRPFSIESGRWWEKIDWSSLIFNQVENAYEIHRLLLGSRCDRGANYPFLAAERSMPGVSKHNVSRIKVDTANAQWHWEENKLNLPFDVSKLDDLCMASSPFRSGIWFLDKTQDKPSVTFTDLRDTSEVSVPLGTTKPPTLKDPAFKGAHELHVAQSGRSTTIWAINGSGNIVGQTAELQPREFDEEIDDLVPTDPTSGRQQLFVLRTGGSVASFNQAGDSKLWSASDLKIPDPEDVKDMSTYICHVHVLNAQGAPLVHTNVQVSTSSQIRGAINGEIVYLSQTARPAQTNEGGNLTVILPAIDLTVPTVTIRGVDLPDISFQPANKAINKLAAHAENGALQNARKKDGKAIFPGREC